MPRETNRARPDGTPWRVPRCPVRRLPSHAIGGQAPDRGVTMREQSAAASTNAVSCSPVGGPQASSAAATTLPSLSCRNSLRPPGRPLVHASAAAARSRQSWLLVHELSSSRNAGRVHCGQTDQGSPAPGESPFGGGDDSDQLRRHFGIGHLPHHGRRFDRNPRHRIIEQRGRPGAEFPRLNVARARRAWTLTPGSASPGCSKKEPGDAFARRAARSRRRLW